MWHNDVIKADVYFLYYQKWGEQNTVFIQDIVTRHGEIMGQDEIEHKYNLRCNFVEYCSIKSAILIKWQKH
jgi:hypothetical protein